MACACKGRKRSTYVWTSGDESQSIIYTSEIQAKAKVLREGGSYKPQ